MDEGKRMNIYEKMAAITSEIKTVVKNLEVDTGRGKSYKAVSERDILDAVKPLEQKYGIYSYPCDREILEAAVLESETTYNGRTTKKSTFFTRMKTTYKFVNIEDPSEFITTITFSEGIDSQDKGSGKAMTYADKYALMKAYKISTGDDPDQDPSNPEGYTQMTPGNGPPPPEPPPPPPPGKTGRPPSPEQLPPCSRCRKQIQKAVLKTGKIMAPGDLVAYSLQRYGSPHCASCIIEIQKNSRQLSEDEDKGKGRRPIE